MSTLMIHGYAQDKLRKFAADSIDCCVTSPPYWGLRDYGIEPSVWGGEAGCRHEWGQEQLRGGPAGKQGSTSQRRNRSNVGEQERQSDSLGAFCQHCGAWRGALGLEPTPQLFIEHMVSIFEQVRRVLKPEGTCWLNIGDSYTSGGRSTYRSGASDNKGHQVQDDQARPNTPPGLKPKDLCLIPFRLAIALQEAGWYVRSDIIWAKPNPMPESVTDRPTKAHEYIFLLTKSTKYYFDSAAVREPFADSRQGRDGGTAASQRNRGGRKDGYTKPSGINPSANGGRNIRSVWTIATQPFPEAHFAVYPEKLIEPCIKAGSPADGLVLDPFMGAGTTAIMSARLGRSFIGIEPSADYIAMARRRLKKAGNL